LENIRFSYTYFEDGVFYVRFHPEQPNFSPEVFRTVHRMLFEADERELKPPYKVEVRDKEGKLFACDELHSPEQGEFVGSHQMLYCRHLPLPLAVRLIDSDGKEFTELVEERHEVGADGLIRMDVAWFGKALSQTRPRN
jgi:hypothetical protein